MKAKPRELLEKEAKLLEYYNDVVHYLRAFNIDENLLEDAIQDTFVEALSSLDTLRDETKMKYWLIKIAKRVGSKYVTKCKNVAIRECSFDEYVLQSRCDIETFCDKDFDTFISGLEREDLYKYISRLRPNEQKALLLYYVYGHKLNEITLNQRIIAGNAQFAGIAAGRGVRFTTGLLLLGKGLGMRETPIRPHS